VQRSESPPQPPDGMIGPWDLAWPGRAVMRVFSGRAARRGNTGTLAACNARGLLSIGNPFGSNVLLLA